MATQKCRHHTRAYQTQQRHLIGHLRKRPDFLHGVSMDRDTAAQISNGGDRSSFNCVRPNADVIVPSFEQKWDFTEPSQGVWQTQRMDQLASWIRGHGKLLRGHCGIWDQELPAWVQQLDGPQHRQALEKAVWDHVYGVVKRYGHQMIAFDVVNEPFKYDGSGEFKESIFWRNLGYDMFVIAFNAANRAKWELKSNVKLYLNEFQIEGTYANNQKKVQAMVNLIDKLRELKVEFQGLGLQGHFDATDFPNNLKEGIELFTNKGLEVSITEMDIRLPDGNHSEDLLNKQAWQYAHVYDVCLSNPRCKLVSRWNIDDSKSYVPQSNPGWGSATMFGPKCQAKPKIFNAVSAVLAKYA